MLEAQQVEELICLVSALDRESLTRQFLSFRGNFPVDVIRHAERRGQPAARRTGIEATTTEWILFGEDDVWLSDGYLMAGRVDDAAQCVERAFDLAQQTKERGHQAWALKLRADVAQRREQIEVAAEAYHQALILSEAMAMRPLRAHCYNGLAGLHASAGAAMQARSDLAAAIDAYQSLGMTHWLGPAQAQLRALSHE